MKQAEFERQFNFFRNRVEHAEKFSDYEGFALAICYVKLGEFLMAQKLFEKSCLAMFGQRPDWRLAAHSSWLVDVWVLSGRKDLYPKIVEALDVFRKENIKSIVNSLLTQYSCGIVELLHPTGMDISQSIRNLTAKPSIKDMYAIGQVFQAILDRDKNAVNTAMEKLLVAHQGQAKHGMLRETPEGFISMPGMSLAYAAHQYGLDLDIVSEYFSADYLAFLLEYSK